MAKKKDLVPQGPRGISYDKATLIKAADAPRFLWGDKRQAMSRTGSMAHRRRST